MKNGILGAAVFIGTVVGAGFATGQEILLYFGGLSPWVAGLAGVLLGALCSLYMYLGSVSESRDIGDCLLKKRVYLSDAFMFICAYISFIAMFSGAETLIMSVFGIRHIGIAAAVLAAVIAWRGMGGIEKLNVVAVPLIFIFIAVIFFSTDNFEGGGGYNPLNAVAYAAMNIALPSSVMFRMGKGRRKGEIITAGVISGGVLVCALVALTLIVRGYAGEMPLHAAAVTAGHPLLSGFIIFLAVFTTMVSALEVSADKFRRILPDRRLGLLTLCLAAYPLTVILSFRGIVDYLYPAVSVMGIILLIFTFVRLGRQGGIHHL